MKEVKKEMRKGRQGGREAGRQGSREAERQRQEMGLGRGSILQTFPIWDPGSFQEEATAGVTGKILNVLIVR